MINLKMQLSVLSAYEDASTLEVDGIIQILDHMTGAHYRRNNTGAIICGGAPVGNTWGQILEWEVYEVELNVHDGQLEIYIINPTAKRKA